VAKQDRTQSRWWLNGPEPISDVRGVYEDPAERKVKNGEQGKSDLARHSKQHNTTRNKPTRTVPGLELLFFLPLPAKNARETWHGQLAFSYFGFRVGTIIFPLNG
jgi:hypothetical protein